MPSGARVQAYVTAIPSRKSERLELIIETLRTRLLRALQGGTLEPGSRIPSARATAAEFKVDFRTILTAYRALADEGLVELRARGGVYVLGQTSASLGAPPLPEQWIADTLAQALQRGLSASSFHDWLRRCTETLRLRAVAIGSTEGECDSLCRELVDDFGLEAEAWPAESLSSEGDLPLSVRRADLVVVMRAQEKAGRAIGERLRLPVIPVDARADPASGEWMLLLRQTIYAVVATPEFAHMLRESLSGTPGVENLRVLVYGQDDLASIPPGAPTYLTHRVRAMVDEAVIRGRLVPPGRIIDSESARRILRFIVHANAVAMAARAEAAK